MTEDGIFWLGLFQILVSLAILITLAFVAYQVFNTGLRTTVVREAAAVSKSIDDVYHFHAKNLKGSKFLYDGNFYVLPLEDIQLSNNDTKQLIDPFSVITNGYCTFKQDTHDYQFGKNLVKAVYHDNKKIYLVVPVSYMQDWVSKRLIAVKDNHYVLGHDLIVSGGIESKPIEVPREPEIISLPLPSHGEIPSVTIH
jgi:hypothetical protein